MFGAGLAFRNRYARPFALDLGLASFGGRDFLGRTRYELGVEADLVLVGSGRGESGAYALLGPNLFVAWVEGLDRTPILLGGHLGLGASITVAPSTAVLLEIDTFLRAGIDEGVSREPEFSDPLTGAHANTSLGALLRAGVSHDL
jgi:hypothetical protein